MQLFKHPEYGVGCQPLDAPNRAILVINPQGPVPRDNVLVVGISESAIDIQNDCPEA